MSHEGDCIRSLQLWPAAQIRAHAGRPGRLMAQAMRQTLPAATRAGARAMRGRGSASPSPVRPSGAGLAPLSTCNRRQHITHRLAEELEPHTVASCRRFDEHPCRSIARGGPLQRLSRYQSDRHEISFPTTFQLNQLVSDPFVLGTGLLRRIIAADYGERPIWRPTAAAVAVAVAGGVVAWTGIA